MRRYDVLYDPQALIDIDNIYFWLADATSLAFANRFQDRLRAYCDGLEYAPFRSPARDDLRPSLRFVVFENCISVGYAVTNEQVRILRLLYRGRALEEAFLRGD